VCPTQERTLVFDGRIKLLSLQPASRFTKQQHRRLWLDRVFTSPASRLAARGGIAHGRCMRVHVRRWANRPAARDPAIRAARLRVRAINATGVLTVTARSIDRPGPDQPDVTEQPPTPMTVEAGPEECAVDEQLINASLPAPHLVALPCWGGAGTAAGAEQHATHSLLDRRRVPRAVNGERLSRRPARSLLAAGAAGCSGAVVASVLWPRKRGEGSSMLSSQIVDTRPAAFLTMSGVCLMACVRVDFRRKRW
jgi:hypothetical protein